MIQDVVHLGFPTADSDVGSFSRGRTGDPNLRRRRLAEEIRLVAQRNRDVAGSIRSRPRIRRFRLLRRNAIPDGMRIHEIWAIRGSIRFEEDPRKKAKARFGFDRVGRNDRTIRNQGFDWVGLGQARRKRSWIRDFLGPQMISPKESFIRSSDNGGR